MAEPAEFGIDHFAVFDGYLHLRGWIRDPRGISDLALEIPGRAPDVSIESRGETVTERRFHHVVCLNEGEAYLGAKLHVGHVDGTTSVIARLGFPRGQRARELQTVFHDMLPREGHMLEIGSRAHSGVTRRSLLPAAWDYTGMDVLEGENVDIVGDAHELSSVVRGRHFDAFMSFSVFEHLLMPWKVAIELNRVLSPGAVGFIQTHQTWPVHEDPWDFFRFSDRAWAGLFNPYTGFEIVEAAVGQPTYIVPQRVHAITDFGLAFTGYLTSAVIVRKIAETDLSWPVRVADVIQTTYPSLVEKLVGV